uniref:Semaphorin-1A n=1 Tax=Globodera pallida TaxID=36090 RepID=A0A183C4S7_GLOPA
MISTLHTPSIAVDNLNPRPRQIVNEVGSTPRFQSPSRSQDQFLLIDANANSILVGARDALFNLSSTKLESRHSIHWKAPGQTIEECHMKGKSESECHNFIRVASQLSNGQVLVCGTHAFSPQCREYEFSQAESRFVERSQFNGQGISPYDPRQNATFAYSDEMNAIFIGAISDFSATDPLIYRRKLSKGETMRTQKDDRVLDDPHFVGSFVYRTFVYFWYRERAADAQDNNREAQYYARVGRVCADDPGGPSPAQDRWSSFLKARLNCSIPGETAPFYFNEIQAISAPVPVEGGMDAVVYAVFQTARALPMSAICSFRMSQIDAIFDHGRFKTQRTASSLWTPFQKFYQNPDERPGRCVDDSKRLSDLVMISKYPFMYDPIPSVGNRPLLIEEAISAPVPVEGGMDAVVYAVFQTARALPMSAICSFRMSQIDAIFDHGRFKTQRTASSLWTPFQKFYQNPDERPGRCVDDSKRLSDLVMISKYPFMYDPIPSVGNRPLLIEGPNRAEMTSLTVASQIESVRKQQYNVIFVGKTDGTILKLVETSLNGSAVLVETVRVFAASATGNSGSAQHAIVGVHVIHGSEPPALVVATLAQLARVPLHHCSQADSCARCVALRDPHCAWDIELRKCVSKRDWSSGSFVQNVLFGVSEQCPGSTKLLGAEGGAAYVIDEDVSSDVAGGGNSDGRAAVPLGGGLFNAIDDDPRGNSMTDEPMQSGLDSVYSAAGGLSVLALVVLVGTLFGFLIGWRISKWRVLSELTRNASSGSSTSSHSSDYADGLGPLGGGGGGSAGVRARLASQDSANKMMVFEPANVYSVGPRSTGGGDTVSLVMSQRNGIQQLVPLTSISTGASRAGSGFVTPRHEARFQTSVGATLPRDYRVKKVYL